MLAQQQIITSAQQTIRLQAQSIEGLISLINTDFSNAVLAIHQCQARVVITGIGKSGIIAQKIVSTFNSTGTPALFMHAADAIHGDLGMIQKNDVVIIVSKSGETPEIKLLVPFIKNFGNTVIAITGNLQGYLAQQANFVIDATVQQEACPNNLAPTTSTTAQLVMGDALAIELMNLKGFNTIDFAKYHPGGNLGKRLYLRVQDFLDTTQSPKVFLNTSLKNIIVEITSKRLGATAVVDENNNALGIITDGDVRRMLERDIDFANITAKDIYTHNAKTVEPNLLAIEALELMRINDISHLIISNNNSYLGILHIHDLIKEGIM